METNLRSVVTWEQVGIGRDSKGHKQTLGKDGYVHNPE